MGNNATALARALHETYPDLREFRECAHNGAYGNGRNECEYDARTILSALGASGYTVVRKPHEHSRLIEASENLFDVFGTRAHDGRALSYEWGEPDGGVYTPTITSTDDGYTVVAREEIAALEAAYDDDARATDAAMNYGQGQAEVLAALTQHYVTAIDCDHDAKTDTVRCNCSVWTGTPQPSVGAAVQEWVEHVRSALGTAEGADRGTET